MTKATSTVQQVASKTDSWRGFHQIIRVTVLWITTLVTGVSFTLAEVSTEPLHVQAGRSIFRLEHLETITRPGQATPDIVLRSDGTAFTVQHNGEAFLVTARHVAEIPYDLRARVPAKRKDTGVTQIIELRIPKESWIFHEQGPREVPEGSTTIRFMAVDVAVAPLPWPKDYDLVVFLYCDQCSSDESNQLATTDPTPPTPVLISGFPADLGLTVQEQRPLFRSGIVALLASSRFLHIGNAYADERSFVVDRRVQRGNSGSPIFNMNPFSGAITLVGLVSAANEAWDFTIATPVSRIRETINRAVANTPPRTPQWHSLAQ
jgi:hypothetical protein